MEATKRPWTTIPELPNDVYQVIPNGYGYLGEFYDGENVSGAANAAFVARAVNTFDQAREALKDACLTYAVHGDQPPQKWLDALAAMEDEPA